MKKTLVLFKLYFKSLLLATFQLGGNKKKAVSGIVPLLFLALLMVAMSTVYSVTLGAQFAPMGGLKLLLLLMGITGLAFSFLITIYSAQSQIFSTKDMDLVLSLPVSSFSIMIARTMALYVEILLAVLLFFAPVSVVYAVLGGEGGVTAAVLFFLSGFALSFLPCLLGLLFSFFMSAIVGRFRYKNVITILLSLLFLGGFLVIFIPFNASMQTDLLTFNPIETYQKFAPRVVPLYLAIEGAVYANFGKIFLLFLLCVIPFVFCIGIFSVSFKKILTLLSSHVQKNNFKLTQIKTANSFKALLAKEAHKFFKTPAYFLNSGVGVILAGLASGYLVYTGKNLRVQINSQAGLSGWIAEIVLVGTIFMVSMIFTSAVSISLEGKNLWILKTAPLDTKTIFAAKAGFNLLLGTIAAVLLLPGIIVGLKTPLTQAAMIFACGVMAALQTSITGLYINLKFPKLDADNETIVVKQSASATISIFAGMGLQVVIFSLFFALKIFNVSFMISSGAVFIFYMVLCGVFYRKLITKGITLFAQL